ncbi:MAG: hypothetical protein WB691_13590 [Pseudolabrys sp.]
MAYGESCVRILHRNINCLGLPMVTIGLAQGDALGGGFESLLSFNVIIAERGADGTIVRLNIQTAGRVAC